MVVDRKWVERNLGFDPISTSAPASAFSFKKASTAASTPEDFQREIIDFDSESSAGKEFFAFSKATGLSRFTEIPWPAGLSPTTGAAPASGSGALPQADVLVVTWTVDEGHALSRVLTPGKDSANDYVSYTHNFAAISKKMRKGCPALNAKRLGAFWTTAIGKQKVVVFKSDSHLSQDVKTAPKAGQTLPNYDVWKQIINEVQPKLIITTGTAGGIGADREVGDVIVSPIVRFDGTHWLKSAPFHAADYRDGKPNAKLFTTAKKLFAANAAQLPTDNTRPPLIVTSTGLSDCVVTTDFFGFDTSNNRYGLEGLGAVSEMGDAILGLVMSDMPSGPSWVAVRNVSDPQIKNVGTEQDQAKLAASIYKGFGRWSTVCSAIVCWSLIGAM